MKFRVTGADSQTGEERRIVVEADDEAEAIDSANSQSVFPYKIEPVTPPQPVVAPSPFAGLHQNKDQSGLIVVLIGVVVVLSCCGIWSMIGDSSSSSSTPAVRSDPFRYDDATDRELKNLPNMRGFSDPEKEEIISAAKKFDAAVKQREKDKDRNR